MFLYREFLGFDTEGLSFNYARRKPKIPVVLSKTEASNVIDNLQGLHKLIAQLMYGSGLRVSEAIRLRVKDVDFAKYGLYIIEAKGDKSRRTFLPNVTVDPLIAQIESVKHLLESDKAIGKAGVYMPDALSRKWPKTKLLDKPAIAKRSRAAA